MIYAPTNSAQSVFVLRKWQIWLSDSWYYIEGHENLDIIWKDMRTLILYWRTWKPAKFNWKCYFAGEQQREAVLHAFQEKDHFLFFQTFLFALQPFFYFKIFLGIFLRGRIILHSWKFTFLWEWTTYFSIVSCPCWIKQKFLFKLSLPGEELACKLQLSEARVQVPLN